MGSLFGDMFHKKKNEEVSLQGLAGIYRDIAYLQAHALAEKLQKGHPEAFGSDKDREDFIHMYADSVMRGAAR